MFLFSFFVFLFSLGLTFESLYCIIVMMINHPAIFVDHVSFSQWLLKIFQPLSFTLASLYTYTFHLCPGFSDPDSFSRSQEFASHVLKYSHLKYVTYVSAENFPILFEKKSSIRAPINAQRTEKDALKICLGDSFSFFSFLSSLIPDLLC